VFILIVLLVGLGARMIKKTLQFAMLGWLDNLGGVVLFIILYTIIFSIFLFYGEKLLLIKPDMVRDSKVYPYIYEWGIKAVNNIGNIMPWFKDMFAQLESFFDGLAKKAAK
jgi:membrane protein required for colicin V production